MDNKNRASDLSEELKKLVSQFEKKQQKLSQVNSAFVKKFGYACLANSLNYEEPKLPKFQKEEIIEHIKSTNFGSIDSLLKYTKSFKTDIDKLFVIFCWVAINVHYDSSSLKVMNEKEVFKTRKTNSEGYANFFIEVAKLAKVSSKTKISMFSNFSKGYGYDPLTVLSSVKPDHASVYIAIDGAQYISEPTWAAGAVSKDNKFIPQFEPDYFLIPLHKALCSHFPSNDSKKLLGFDFKLEDFTRAMEVSPVGIKLKTESHPFVNFACENGYLEQQYSCIAPVKSVSLQIWKKKPLSKMNEFEEINCEHITSYKILNQVIPKSNPKRTRFETYISFPEQGFYKVRLYVNGIEQINYFVSSEAGSSQSVPLKYDFSHDSRFIPISPLTHISTVSHGASLIRFAVVPHRSEILYNINKVIIKNGRTSYEDGESLSRKFGYVIKLLIPFDPTRYEIQLLLTFPADGFYHTQIFLENNEESFTKFIDYYFDVKGSTAQDPLFPTMFLSKNRLFAPVHINGKGIVVRPAASMIIINNEKELERQIEIDTPRGGDDQISLNFNYIPSGLTIFPEEVSRNKKTSIFKWTIPEVGIYELRCFINSVFEFSQFYEYRKEQLREPTKQEKDLMDDLRCNVENNGRTTSRANSRSSKKAPVKTIDSPKDESINAEGEEGENKPSKCCLLL